jgi:hypothetical protein
MRSAIVSGNPKSTVRIPDVLIEVATAIEAMRNARAIRARDRRRDPR